MPSWLLERTAVRWFYDVFLHFISEANPFSWCYWVESCDVGRERSVLELRRTKDKKICPASITQLLTKLNVKEPELISQKPNLLQSGSRGENQILWPRKSQGVAFSCGFFIMGYPRKAAMLVIGVSKLLFLLCADNMMTVSAFANQGSMSVLARLISLKAHWELNVSGPWLLIKGLLHGLFLCVPFSLGSWCTPHEQGVLSCSYHPVPRICLCLERFPCAGNLCVGRSAKEERWGAAPKAGPKLHASWPGGGFHSPFIWGLQVNISLPHQKNLAGQSHFTPSLFCLRH